MLDLRNSGWRIRNRSSINYRRWSSGYQRWYNTRFLPATFGGQLRLNNKQ